MSQNTGTIDYGIDLGTTTSSIAKVDGSTTIIVPNSIDNKNFVSSAVYIRKNGNMFIGDKAKDKIAIDPDNGYAEFKLRMGSDHVYEFKATGQTMTPVELSAEILKNLKNTVKDIYDYDLRAAVITVPADFTAIQTKDTTEAAKLAGIEQVILIQEPTAAAMAYGFDSSGDNEIWMIYDLGGGTFDVSIMKKTNEEIVNLNNHGDALLGGKLIDLDVVDKVLVPAVIDELGLTDFSRDNSKYKKQFAKLKKAAETVKKDLSNSDMAEIDIENFIIKEDGDVLDFYYEMERSALDEIMKPYVDRTINHCKEALESAHLSINEVTKIILVGGSTLSPYIHERLSQEFNIPLEHTIDPTTVVARGAAIYAGTQPLNLKSVPGGEVTEAIDVKLQYDTLGDDIEFEVQGTLSKSNGSVDGYSIEFINNKTKYSPGKIAVDSSGYFEAELMAEDENDYNFFEIKVYDATGNLAEISSTSPNTIKYKIAPILNKPILSHTIGLGLKGNILDVLVKKGTPLPFTIEKQYKNAQAVEKGNHESKVFMPLYEGTFDEANLNTLLGSLTVRGDEISRDLPEGSEIILTVTVTESMLIKSSIDIPVIGYLVEKDGLHIVPETKSVDILSNKYESEKERYYRLKVDCAGSTNQRVRDLLQQIDDENIMESIEGFLKTCETNPDALDSAQKQINKFTSILNEIEKLNSAHDKWDELKRLCDDIVEEIEKRIPNADPKIVTSFNQIKPMHQEALDTHNERLLETVFDKFRDIFSELYEEEIVLATFMNLVENGEFMDQTAADNLFSQGFAAINSHDMGTLKRITGQLIGISKKEIQPPKPPSNPFDQGVNRY